MLSLPTQFMRAVRLTLASTLALIVVGCDENEPADPVSFSFSFVTSAEGWRTGIADYSDNQESDIGFFSEHRPNPVDFAASDGALYLRGQNVSDDLKMYATRAVEGLVPGTRYEVGGLVRVGSQVGIGCFGPGGSPGESVVIKVGASATEPRTVRRPSPASADFVLTIDVGGQNLVSRGPDGLSIGDLAVPEAICGGRGFFPKTLSIPNGELTAAADRQGRLWLLVGTDSGHEGIDEVYFDEIEISLVPE